MAVGKQSIAGKTEGLPAICICVPCSAGDVNNGDCWVV